MKNLLIYINPRKGFDEEHQRLAKIQIDNSLSLGWKKEDILLVTNFAFEHNGIRALIIDDSHYCVVNDKASKINSIIHLFECGLLNELIWFHDFDAYQLQPISEEELGLDSVDAGFTDYGWWKKWNTGSIFFKPSSLDIFRWIREGVYENNTGEEEAMVILTDNNTNNINSRIKRLNISYNFGKQMVNYDHKRHIADKPLKVAHFHPKYPGQTGVLEKFKPLLNQNLIDLFRLYGFE